MSKFIVTTTINKPTVATLKYCEIAVKKNWKFVIVGDLKTPHAEYKALENDNVIYLSPEQQESFCKELKIIHTSKKGNLNFNEIYPMDIVSLRCEPIIAASKQVPPGYCKVIEESLFVNLND